MAELAAGAVSSLLSVIGNEALLLRGVRDDVQFIKEEMESMNSFLLHLARTAPPGGEHDEQVRTWMNQVRVLAQDCNNCIDLYLYSGNPDIQRTRGKIRRYLWWAYWLLHKLVAQHRAAVQLGQLKERARDVGERRLRYGVEVPTKLAAERPPHIAGQTAAVASAYAAEDDEEDGEDELPVATASESDRSLTVTYHSGRRSYFEPRTLDDYVKEKLLEWVRQIPVGAVVTLSISIMAPDGDQEALSLAQETLGNQTFSHGGSYHGCVKVDIPTVHMAYEPLRPKDVLYYILRELKLQHSKSQSHERGTDHSNVEKGLSSFDVFLRKHHIRYEKEWALHQIKESIEEMKIYERLDKIKSHIPVRTPKDLEQNKGVDQLDLEVLLQVLFQSAAVASQQGQLKNKDIHKLHKHGDNMIAEIARKFKEYMEADQGGGGGVEGRQRQGEEQGEGVVAVREHEEGKGEEKQEAAPATGGGGDEQGEGESTVGVGHEEGEATAGGVGHEEGEAKEKQEAAAARGEGGGGERQVEATAGVEYEEGEGEGEEKQAALAAIVGGGGGGGKGQGEGGAAGGGHEGGGGESEWEEQGERAGHEEGGEEKEVTTVEARERGVECEGDGEGDNDERQQTGPIHLHGAQYERILWEVFPKTSISKPQAQQQDRSAIKQATKTTFGEDPIKQMIQEAKQEILRELQEGNYDKNQEIGESGTLGEFTEDIFEEIIEQKMDKIKQAFEEQWQIKGLVDRIKYHLKGANSLFILKVDETIDVPRWEDIRYALSLLECSADALIVTTKKDTQQAKEYCYPPREPIDYSPIGLYYDTVLELTSQQRNEDNCTPQIFRGILEECEPYEFCMKIFTHALYANPKKSNEELIKLYNTLQASPRSFDILAKKMFKFSYSDLPKEYKSCLLYLAIFPLGYKIKRSNLIGRWVAEGLIFKQDWPSSVRQANRCFDALINRWLVYPADIGATGKVKSCVVGDIVYGFITKIAKTQHIVEPRLSHHLARHFSIFNDLQLRRSDKIENFFQRHSKLSRVSLLKVLDVEGCQCFGGKNQRYLKDICSKMLLLKYLSLRRTNITQLPNEINNLHELEVLDIRQTKVPENATRHVLLLKLKRLLAGHIDQSAHSCETGTAIRAHKSVSSVQIPRNIRKMVHLEVLSNVKPKHSHDLKYVGKIWQLRKLGVIIDYNNDHLRNLLQAINDQHEFIRSLSVTLPIARHEDTSSSRELPADIVSCLQHHPKFLESLNISGSTLTGHLLPLFAKDVNNNYLEVLGKVTLSRTSLNHNYLEVLGNLPKLRCVRLQYIEFTESVQRVLTFKEEEFKYLKYLLVERSNLTEIIFKDRATPELEKMVLSFTNIASIIGVDRLQKLEELELNNNYNARLLSSFADAKQIVELTLRGTLLTQDDLEILTKKPKMRSLALLDMSVSGIDGLTSQITFKNYDFLKLNQLTVRCSTITDVVFTAGSAPKLEKIVWSVTSLSGINNLPRLKELEFHGDLVPDEVRKAIKEHKNKPNLNHAKPENQDQAIEDAPEEDAAVRFPLCWKNQI